MLKEIVSTTANYTKEHGKVSANFGVQTCATNSKNGVAKI